MKPQDILHNFDITHQRGIDAGRLIGIMECYALMLEVLNKSTAGEDYLRDYREQLTDAVLKLYISVFKAAQDRDGQS